MNPSPLSHPLIDRLPDYRTRARIAELRRCGFVEQPRLLAPWHLAELVRLEDGAAVTVARGGAGEVVFLFDRPCLAVRQLNLSEVCQ